MAHLPRSMRRQRSLQNGKSSSAVFTSFLQVGQWSGLILGVFAIGFCRLEYLDSSSPIFAVSQRYIHLDGAASLSCRFVGEEKVNRTPLPRGGMVFPFQATESK